MADKMSVKEFVERFNAGEFDAVDVDTQIKIWFDWFCKDTSLAAKTQTLGKKVVQIANSPRFNKETSYVFFKNNCPIGAPLYDSFSICDLETERIMFWVAPNNKGKTEIWGPKNLIDSEMLFQGNWIGAKKWFNSPE